MVAQDLALHRVPSGQGADTWAWVEALRAAVGAERWLRYWAAFAALPIAPARRLLAPIAPRAPMAPRRNPGQRMPARVLHRQARPRRPGCRACDRPLRPRACSERGGLYCWDCLHF